MPPTPLSFSFLAIIFQLVVHLMCAVYMSWWGNQRERNHWGDLGIDRWIILGWISRRWDVGMWTGFGWPRIGTGGGRL